MEEPGITCRGNFFFMAGRIDLNADLGEGFPYDEDLIGLVSTANICCGAHAGSPELARQLERICRAKNVRVCAHPGYPDRENMGRQSLSPETLASPAELLEGLWEQVLVLQSARAVKPHGAFYHDSGQTPEGCSLLLNLLVRRPLTLVGFPVGLHRAAARAGKAAFEREGFVDRGYDEEGRLIPRGNSGAILETEAEIRAQALRLAEEVDTLCLHGDTPHCVDIARLVRMTLVEAGWTIGSP
jgi:UPF0271 protein